MNNYRVEFKFVGGESRSIEMDVAHGDLESIILNSGNGWFCYNGELVNLRNVTFVKIMEKMEQETFSENMTVEEFLTWS